MKQILHKLPPFTFTAITSVIILYLTLVPHPLPDSDIPIFPGADKLVHAIMFGALAVAIAIDRARTDTPQALAVSRLVAYAIIATLTGGFIELLQNYMALGRDGDCLDFIADTFGAFSGAGLAVPIWHRIIK